MSGAMSQFPMAGGMGMSPGLGSAPGVPQGGMSGGPPGMGQQQMNPQMLQALMQAMQQRQGGMQRPPMAGAPPGLPGAPQMQSPMPPMQNPNLAAFGQSAMGQGAGGRPRLTPAEMARLGQHGDSIVAHLTPGEMMVPPQVQTPKVLATLRQAYGQAGVSPAQFTAGSSQQSVNPRTQAPQFAGTTYAPDESASLLLSAIQMLQRKYFPAHNAQPPQRVPPIGSTPHTEGFPPNIANSIEQNLQQHQSAPSINPQTGLPQYNWLDSWLPAIIGAAGVAAAPFSGGASLAGTAAAEGAAAAPAVAGGATAALGSELAAAAPAVAGTAAGGAAAVAPALTGAAAPALAGAAPAVAQAAGGAATGAATGAAATGATGAATEGGISGAAPAAAQAATHAATDATILPPQVAQNMAPFRAAAAAANQGAPISSGAAAPINLYATSAEPVSGASAAAPIGPATPISTPPATPTPDPATTSAGYVDPTRTSSAYIQGGTPPTSMWDSLKSAAPYLGTAAKVGTAVAPLAASLFPSGGAKNPATAGYGQVANKPLANPPGAYLGGNPSAIRPQTPTFQGYDPFKSVYGQPYQFFPAQQQ